MAINKKERFEVFKRDKFTCQYCGRSAPDVLLQVDHIHPVSKGGEDDMLNYITSCFDCNSGKGNRLLSDDTVIKRRKRQLDELQERREQFEMLMEWHRSLISLEAEIIEELYSLWADLVPGFHLNELGVRRLRKWIKRFSINELIVGMRESTNQYLRYDDDSEDPMKPTHESVEKAWDYIPRICVVKRQNKDKLYMRALYYTRGILRNRLSYVNEWKSIHLMETAVLAGVSINEIQDIAKLVTSWTQFREAVEGLKSLAVNGQCIGDG